MSKTRRNQDEARSGWTAALRAPQAAPPWTTSEVIIALVVLLLAMMILASGVALSVAGDAGTTPTSLILGWSVGGAIAAAYALFTFRRKPEYAQGLRLVRSRPALPLVLLLSVGAALSFDLIVAAVSGSFRPAPVLTGIGTGGLPDWLLAGLFMVVIQPVAEGLIFWGVMLPRLRVILGPVPGWLVVALLYALYSFMVFGSLLPQQDALWYGGLLPLLIGLYLGTIRVVTGSTLSAIIGQAGVGLTLIAIALSLVT